MSSSASVREQLPAHILAPYVAAAAGEVEQGDQLDPLSERALNEAVIVLSAERATLRGEDRPTHSDNGSALATPTGNSLQIATLLLDAWAQEQHSRGPTSYREAVDMDAAALDELIQLIERTLHGDRDAAGRLKIMFGHVVDRVLIS